MLDNSTTNIGFQWANSSLEYGMNMKRKAISTRYQPLGGGIQWRPSTLNPSELEQCATGNRSYGVPNFVGANLAIPSVANDDNLNFLPGPCAHEWADLQDAYELIAEFNTTNSTGSVHSSSSNKDEFSSDRRNVSREARNSREQRRAHKISAAISHLKNILDEAEFPTKSSSKLHTLSGCEAYIKQLQARMKHLKNVRCTRQKHLVSFPSTNTSETFIEVDNSCSSNSSNGNRRMNEIYSSEEGGSDQDESSSNDGKPWSSLRTSSSFDYTNSFTDPSGLTSGLSNSQSPAANSGMDTVRESDDIESGFDFKAWFKMNHIAMAVLALDGGILDFNQEFCNLLKFAPETLQLQALSSLLPSSMAEFNLSAAFSGKNITELSLNLPASQFDVELMLNPVFDSNGHMINIHIAAIKNSNAHKNESGFYI